MSLDRWHEIFLVWQALEQRMLLPNWKSHRWLTESTHSAVVYMLDSGSFDILCCQPWALWQVVTGECHSIAVDKVIKFILTIQSTTTSIISMCSNPTIVISDFPLRLHLFCGKHCTSGKSWGCENFLLANGKCRHFFEENDFPWKRTKGFPPLVSPSLCE